MRDGGRGKTRSVTAKYRNPKNADEVWSGRGRMPLWLGEAYLSIGLATIVARIRVDVRSGSWLCKNDLAEVILAV
jgi:hypothetical protein